MSSVSTGERIAAWNVEFLDSSRNAFAGLFQAKDMVTYGDAFDELQLCFDLHLHNDLAIWRIPAREETADITLDDVCISARAPSATLQQPVHLDYPFDLDSDLSSTKYAVVNHNGRECSARQSTELDAHVRARCACPIYEPQTRQPPWYRRIGTVSDDPKILSSTPRRSRSPKKRSGASSPQKPGEVIHDPNDPTAPAFMANKDLQRHMDAFRENAQSRAICCAVSGLGKKWSGSGGLGPSLQACHIVPQKLWDLYPLAEDHEGEVELYSSRRLESKWNKTWGVDNCLWMQSSIHIVHDLRLLAINPNNLNVRCFAPYDLVYPYHTQAAHIKPRNRPDPAALKFHWNSCVYENMTAKIPWRAPSSFGLQSPHEEQELVGDEVGGGSSPKRQRLFSGEGLSGVSIPILHGQGQTGAEEVMLHSTTPPPKRQWLLSSASLDDIPNPTLHGQDEFSAEADIMPELHMSDSTTPLCMDSEVDVRDEEKEEKKERWSLGSVLGEKEEDGDRDRYITSENHQTFLADVNWELKRSNRF